MMLWFEQGKELQVGDVLHLQGWIAEIHLCQFLDNLNHASTRCDGATREMSLVDHTFRKELDTKNRIPTTLFKRCRRIDNRI